MASFSTQYSSVDSAEPLVPALPLGVPEGVFAFFYQNATIGINRSPGGAPFTDIGSGPTYVSDGATFIPYTNALKTGIACVHTGMTLMAVWRRRVAGGSTGAYHRIWAANPTPFATPFFGFNPTTVKLEAFGTTVAGPATLSIAGSLDSYRFVVAAMGDNLATTIYNVTDNTESTDGNPNGILFTTMSTSFMELGSGLTGGPTRQNDFVWGGLVTTRMTKPQILAYHATIKASMALMPAIKHHVV